MRNFVNLGNDLVINRNHDYFVFIFFKTGDLGCDIASFPEKLYVRFFDVVWDNAKKEPIPSDKIVFTKEKPGLAVNIAKDVTLRSSKNVIHAGEIILDHD